MNINYYDKKSEFCSFEIPTNFSVINASNRNHGMDLSMYLCMYVCMYVWMDGWMDEFCPLSQSCRDLFSVWNDVWHWQFQVTASRYEDLILFSFFLQMKHEGMLKPNKICLKCKYQVKYITVMWENPATDKHKIY